MVDDETDHRLHMSGPAGTAGIVGDLLRADAGDDGGVRVELGRVRGAGRDEQALGTPHQKLGPPIRGLRRLESGNGALEQKLLARRIFDDVVDDRASWMPQSASDALPNDVDDSSVWMPESNAGCQNRL